MALNFLQALSGFGGSGRISPLALAQQSGEIGLGKARLDTLQTPNIIQQLLQTPQQQRMAEAPLDLPGMGSPDPIEMQEGSQDGGGILDKIGRVADVLARVGGAEALYQPTLQAEEDRQRQIDLEEMQKRVAEQQMKMGGLEIGAAEREPFGDVLAAVASSENPGQTWRQLAPLMGADEAKVAQIGSILDANPGMAKALALAHGYDAPAQGSQAKEIQVYEFLASKDPELAKTYMKSIANPEAMNQKELMQMQLLTAQFGLANRQFEENQYQFDVDAAGKAEERHAKNANKAVTLQGLDSATSMVKDIDAELDAIFEAGGMNDPSRGAAGNVWAGALENVPFLERTVNPEGFSARSRLDNLLSQGIQTLVPLLGGIQLGGKNIDAGKELEFWKNAILNAKDYTAAKKATQGFQNRIKQLRAVAATETGSANRPPPRRGSSGGGAPAKGLGRTPKPGTPAPRNGGVSDGWKLIGVE